MELNLIINDVAKNRGCMTSDKKQKENEDLNSSLNKFSPSKIFIEWEPEEQAEVDSLFGEYQKGKFKVGANEVYQIGFKLASKLNHKTLFCMDAPGDYRLDTLISTMSIFCNFIILYDSEQWKHNP